MLPARPFSFGLLLPLMAAASILGCPKRSGPPSDGARGGECELRLPAETLAPTQPPSPPELRSRLSLELSAELSAIERELGREVPTRLAGERRRPVGAPGEVTYSVTRGPFSLRLDGDRLLCAVPVSVEVEICKPLGPFCPVYGQCSPRLAAVASVPLLLDERYEIGRSRVGISVVRPCTIAGIDATPEIRRRAAGAVGLVQRRIDAALPELRPSVAAVWELLHHPVMLGTSTCLRIEPEHVIQGHPHAEGRRVSTHLAAEGRLRIEDPCKDPNAAVRAAPLPAIQTRESVPEALDLEVPVHVSYADVESSILRSLSTATPGSDRPGQTERVRVLTVEAFGTGGGDHGRVLLRLGVAGAVCGDAWLSAEPWFDPRSSRIRLRDVRQASATPVLALAGLLRQIEVDAAIALPVDVTTGPAAIEGLIRGFGSGLPDSVVVESAMAPARVDPIVASQSGLVAVAIFSGKAALRVK